MPFEAQHKIFKRLAEIADSKSLPKEEQEKYDNSMMVMWENYAVYKHAEEKGYKKGYEEGYKIGYEEGYKKGYEEGYKKGYEEGYKIGYEEGKKKNSKKIALNLLAYNTPIDIIAKSTDLSVEEIKKLKQ